MGSTVLGRKLARRAFLTASATGQSSREVVSQDHGAVVLGVMRAVEERYGTSPRGVEYRCPHFRLGVQLLDITAPEFRPTRHTMSEPFAQLRARRNVLHPRMRFKGFLRDPSRPEPLHQDAAAIAARSPFICAFDTYHCSSLSEADLNIAPGDTLKAKRSKHSRSLLLVQTIPLPPVHRRSR